MNKHPIILEAYRIINEPLMTGEYQTVWGMPLVETEGLLKPVMVSSRMFYGIDYAQGISYTHLFITDLS